MLLDIIQSEDVVQENITDRAKYLVRYFCSNYVSFEEITGVSASKWRDLDRGKTKAATAEMIEALGTMWPEFAYWLVTGNSKNLRGETSPDAYFGSATGLYVVEPASREFTRNEEGFLAIESQSIDKWAERELQEIALCEQILHFSGLANETDAKNLAPGFWQQFIKQIPHGASFTVYGREVKAWINLHQIRPVYEHDLDAISTTLPAIIDVLDGDN